MERLQKFLARAGAAMLFCCLVSSLSAAGNGLRGDYFNSLGFTNLAASQTNATVDFNWGASPPVGGLGGDAEVHLLGEELAQAVHDLGADAIAGQN